MSLDMPHRLFDSDSAGRGRILSGRPVPFSAVMVVVVHGESGIGSVENILKTPRIIVVNGKAGGSCGIWFI